MLVAITLAIAVSGALCIYGQMAHRDQFVYFFKPLTTLLIISLPVIFRPGAPSTYWQFILLGLAFSLAGDVFLMMPSDKFIHGLGSFLIGHICFSVAFLSLSRHSSWWLAGIFAAFGLAMFLVLLPGLGGLRYPVLVYILVILFMAWRATENSISLGTTATHMALAGSILFLFSDTALALDHFRAKYATAPLVILSTYYAAIYFIARSAMR